MNENFSKQLSHLIKLSPESNNKIINQTGIDRSTFYQFLSGKRIPTFKQFGAIIKVLAKDETLLSPTHTTSTQIIPQAEIDLLLSNYLEAKDDPDTFALWRSVNAFIKTAQERMLSSQDQMITDDQIKKASEDVSQFIKRQLTSKKHALDLYVSPAVSDALHLASELQKLSENHQITIRQIIGIEPNNSTLQETHILLQNIANILPILGSGKITISTYKSADSSLGKENDLFPYYLLGQNELMLISHTGDICLTVKDEQTVTAYHALFDSRINNLKPFSVSLNNYMELASMLNAQYQHFGDRSFIFVADRPCSLQIMTPAFIDKHAANPALNTFAKQYTATLQSIPNFCGMMSPSGLSAFEKDRTIYEAGMNYHLDDEDLEQFNSCIVRLLENRMLIIPFSNYFIPGWEIAIYDQDEILISLHKSTNSVIDLKNTEIAHAFYIYYDCMREMFIKGH